MSDQLFPAFTQTTDGKTCRTCAHRQRCQRGNSVFQYCAVRASARTGNGLTKIHCKDKACHLYKEKTDV